MTAIDDKPEGYITLKEASELFGYSPDYVGQLIRKGKIEGKQVYANVAWMTTKASIEEYLAREGRSSRDSGTKGRFVRALASPAAAEYATWALRALIPFLALALLLVVYFLSIVIDERLRKSAEERLPSRTAELVRSISQNGNVDQLSRYTYEK